MGNVVPLVVVAVVMTSIFGRIILLTHVYRLNEIKNKMVGYGQHGIACWTLKKEIYDTYVKYHSILKNGIKKIICL